MHCLVTRLRHLVTLPIDGDSVEMNPHKRLFCCPAGQIVLLHQAAHSWPCYWDVYLESESEVPPTHLFIDCLLQMRGTVRSEPSLLRLAWLSSRYEHCPVDDVPGRVYTR